NSVPQQADSFPSFTTFPPAGTSTNFMFIVITDLDHVNYDNGAPVYGEVDAENPRFVLQIGDFDHSDVTTLSMFRDIHTRVRSRDFQAGRDFMNHIATRFPFFHVWDDHDYGTDNSDNTFIGRADSLRAFKEYYPMPDLPNGDNGIWHKFSYGQAE